MSTNYKNLFLRQSYLDQTELYENVLQGRIEAWDYVVITASNEEQAFGYRQQIDFRLNNNRLPKKTKYLVVQDPNGERVGSGGATLNLLNEIVKDRGSKDFKGLKILVLHSGGDSKRVPQYSACGKLFSPVPRILSDGRRSTLFDEFMIGFCGVANRITDGAVFCSGDVVLLFNPLQIDFYSPGAAAFSIKENVETGKNHGVYLADKDGNVGMFLHKLSVEKLKELEAVDNSNNVNIDTGAMVFDSNILNDLYSLVDTPEKLSSLVNEHVRLSLYADFSYPLATSSTLEGFYQEIPEGDFSPELLKARKLIWDKLHKYSMKLIRFSPAAFLHFGTTQELLKLMTQEMDDYRYLDWKSRINTNSHFNNYSISNSYISIRATIGKGCYIEDSYVHHGTVVGENSVISGVTLTCVTVPSNVVLHGLKLKDGRFVARMYSVIDNPKECKWLSTKLKEPLWSTPLFKICETMEEAVEATLNKATDGELISLKASFNKADVTQILPWQEKLNDKIKAESLLEAIDNRVSAKDAINIFVNGISPRCKAHLLREAVRLDENDLTQFSRKLRIYYYLSKLVDKDEMADKCFSLISKTVLKAAIDGTHYNKSNKIIKNEVVTTIPVRVNWGGGWSDTPPYCLENGGTVLNAAITIDGRCPIEVTIKRTDRATIELASTDIGSHKEFTSITELQNCTNYNDSFALHKAALIACGVIPYKEDISIKEIGRAHV